MDLYGLFVESETQKTIKLSTSKIIEKGKKEKDAITKLQKDYNIESHLNVASNQTKELFMQLKEMITSLDESIIEEAKAKYIAYKLTTNFVDILIQKNAIKAYLNIPIRKLKDSYNIARDLTKPSLLGMGGMAIMKC